MSVVHSILRSVLSVSAMLGAIVVVGVVALWYMGPDGCGNEIIAQYASPSHDETLVVFQRDCGATNDFSTQASLLPAGRALRNQPGNVFIADTDHGAAPAGPGGGPELRVSWEGPRELLLSYHPRTRVFKGEANVAGINIRYEQVAPAP